MKSKIISKLGKEKGEIILPKNFTSKIRPDILAKVFEVQKLIYSQQYGSKPNAGAGYSASGILKHKRHDWKSAYNKGISRIPRKIMSRNGASFNWVGATVSNTRGGRRPHSPTSAKNVFNKINKKEMSVAMNSAFSATIDKEYLKLKYLEDVNSGLIFEKEILKLKSKELFAILEKLLGETFKKALKKKKIRAGKGKTRGRKYKRSAGLLFVIGEGEKMNRKGIDVISVKNLKIADLAPNGEPGRLVCYTESAIKEIGEFFN